MTTPGRGEYHMDTDLSPARPDEPDGYVLVDPLWQPESEDDVPPLDAVIGLWPFDQDGGVGKFQGNPGYRPADANAPSDPLDAVLRLLVRDEASVAELRSMLRNTLFDLAVADGRPLETTAPDGARCVLVATGAPHRARLRVPGWRRIDLEELVLVLADRVDVLVNPIGPASLRLTGEFMRETVLTDDAVAAE